MKAILLLSIVLASVYAVCGECDACLEEQCYTKQYLCDAAGYDLVKTNLTNALYIDRNRKQIYFNLAYIKDTELGFQVRRFSLDTNGSSTYGSWRLHDLTVDEKSSDIYLIENLKQNIYKFNISHYYIEPLNLPKEEYNRIEFTDKLYFTINSVKGISFYKNEETKVVPGTENHYVEDFIVDKKSDIYFVTADMKVWRLKNGLDNATEFSYGAVLLTLDKNGNAYFINITTRGVYSVNYETEQIHKVGAINDVVTGVVFDNDNSIIYISANKTYSLKRDNQTAHCFVPSNKIITANVSVNQSDYKHNETAEDVSLENNETSPRYNDTLVKPETTTMIVEDEQKNNVSTEKTTDIDIPAEDEGGLPEFLKRFLPNQKDTKCNCDCPKISRILSTVFEFK